MGVSDTTEKDWEEHYKEEMIMNNEFFNFDAVVEIEKKKSYNKALEDLWNTLVKYQRAIENANYPFNFIQIAFDEVRERLK